MQKINLKDEPKRATLSYAQGNFPKAHHRRDARHFIALIFSVPFLFYGIGMGALVAYGCCDLLIHGTRGADMSELFCVTLGAVISSVSGLFLITFYYRGEE